jgi:hypothetical protein
MTMREIPVSGGRVTLVDETDYPLVAHLSWHARRGRTTTYAVHSDWDGAARRNRDTYMHRLILGASPSWITGERTCGRRRHPRTNRTRFG